jgi:hypothetical protein
MKNFKLPSDKALRNFFDSWKKKARGFSVMEEDALDWFVAEMDCTNGEAEDLAEHIYGKAVDWEYLEECDI